VFSASLSLSSTQRETELDRDLEEIESAPSHVQMFVVLRKLSVNKSSKPVIGDILGNIICEDRAKVEKVAAEYSAKYDGLPIITTPPLNPLAKPVLVQEVANAVRRLRNGKAAGPDGIMAEQLKLAPEEVFSKLAAGFNEMVISNGTFDLC
jgi:hypothetical protein